jgi:hypothetical protein
MLAGLSQSTHESTEVWEASFENIPQELQEIYAPIVGGLSVNTRVNFFKILHEFNWSLDVCNKFLQLIRHCGEENMSHFVEIFHKVHTSRILKFTDVLLNLEKSQFIELLTKCPTHVVLRFMELVYYCDPSEIVTMAELMGKLSIMEVHHALERCDHPKVTNCRLCKSKRVSALEQRLLNDQIESQSVSECTYSIQIL